MAVTVMEPPIARLIRERCMSAAKVAAHVGMTRSKLSRLCTGNGSSRLTAEEAVKLSRLFGVTVEELLPGGGGE